MEIKVAEVLETITKTSKAGKPYPLSTFKGEDGKLYKDMYGKFTVGQVLNGEWKDTEYGAKFVIDKPAGGSSGFTPRGSNPDERKSIERQVCLKAAVEIATAKINIGDKQMSPAKVLGIADQFVAWLTDHKVVPNTVEEILAVSDPEAPTEDLSDAEITEYTN